MILLHGKIYYLAPAYPMLFAAGAVWLEDRLLLQKAIWLKPVVVTSVVVSGLICAPLAMPILPAKMAVKYSRFWHVESIRVENVPLGELPQLFADMYGWPEQVQTIARVFNALRFEKQQRCGILAYNYGEAAAVDYFGPAYRLPKAISGHNQYALWGTRGFNGDTVIAIGFTEQRLRENFGQVLPAAQVKNQYAVPEEANLTIYLCRKPKSSLREISVKLKWLG